LSDDSGGHNRSRETLVAPHGSAAVFGAAQQMQTPAGRATVDHMTAKEQLRTVVDELSEHEAADTLAFIARRRDALGELLASAPVDDEPTTPDEDAGVADARAQIARGEVFSAEDIRREFA